MTEIKKKQTCKCENCGNEAEMVVTCTLSEEHVHTKKKAAKPQEKVKGTATCTHCGNEADMWIDI